MGLWTGARGRQMLMPSERADVTIISSCTALKNHGVYMLGSTSTGGPIECTIPAPTVGCRVEIICRTASTAGYFYIDATSSGFTFDGSNDRLTMGTGDTIQLIGYTSSRYQILNLYAATTMTLSTST